MNQTMPDALRAVSIHLTKAQRQQAGTLFPGKDASFTLLLNWLALLARYCAQDELQWIDCEGAATRATRSIAIASDCSFQRLAASLQQTLATGSIAAEPGPLSINGRSVRTLTAHATDACAEKDGLCFVVRPQAEHPPAIAAHGALFEKRFLEQMAVHFELMLEHCLQNPEQNFFAFPLLTEAERRDAVVTWNKTAQYDCNGRNLHGLFTEQAKQFPDRIAVSCQGREMTYKELDIRSNQVAHAIRAHFELFTGKHLCPDELIGLSTDRSIDMIIGILAILKAGGAYVPLDPRYPEDRLKYMAENSRCRIILTQQQHLENLLYMVNGDYGIISLDTGWEHLSQYPRTCPASVSSDENLAYVIYTSGSTGKPKGVMLEHGCAVRLFDATEELFELSEQDVWTCFHSYAFDFSVWEIWGALLHGARLVIVPYDVSREPDRFHELVCREKVSVMSQTPSSFYQFSEADKQAKQPCASLRYVVYGGEALNVPRLESWWRRHPCDAPKLINMYGITETTVHATFYELGPDDLKRASALSPIGERLPDLSFYVLDSLLQPVPPGIPGELYIGGAGVARGYFLREDLSRERFIPSPFLEESGAHAHTRLYKSGDLVVRKIDGSLDYLGRADFQVKIRGFRIETGEIESALESNPAIKESVVLAYGQGENKKLAAYYVATDGNPVPVRILWEHLAQTLPDYMIPSRFIHVDKFTLSPTGKTDRKALPDPEKACQEQDHSDMIVARTATERRLAGIWSKLLRVGAVGATDNFFMLGGDSLLGARMVMHCRKTFARDISIRHVFNHPVLEDLAREIEDLPVVEESAAQNHCCEATGADSEFPVSPAQRSMYYLYHAEAPQTYNVPFLVRFDGVLDPVPLQAALNSLLERHESLRTVFSFRQGEVYQRILEPRVYELPVERIPEDALSQTCAKWAEQAFDLETYPLFDIRLIDCGNKTSALYINIHHIVFDGNSYDVLLKDLARAYGAALHRKPPLPAPHWQYRHYALAMRNAEQNAQSKAALEELARQFENLDPEIHWPRSVLTDTRQENNLIRSSLDCATVRQLSGIARQHNATLFALLLALYQSAIYALSGQEDLTVGVPVSSRPLYPQAENLIGFLVVTAPFRTRFHNGLTLGDLVADLQQRSLAMLDRQEIPLDALARMLDRQREQNAKPLFQALFAMENSMSMSGAWQDLNYDLEQLFNNTHKFDALLFCFNRQEQGLEIILEYNPETPGRHLAAILVENFVGLAKALAANQQRAQALELRDWIARAVAVAADRERTEYPEVSLGELCSRCAAKHPERTAYIWQGRSTTYGELDALSNRLAGAIVAQTGRPGRPGESIGIHLRRSPEMVVAMLGILKSGYAYLPLDPDLPEQRLARIHAHACPALVICTEEEDFQRFAAQGTTTIKQLLDRTHAYEPASLPPQHPAYILYTSGTTGVPKGVVVSHRSAVNRVCWMQRTYGLEPEERYLLKTPSHFDVSVGEIFWPLTCGATLVVSPAQCHRDPACILETLQTEKAANVHFVPAMLSIFLDFLESCEKTELPHLKRIFCSGEGLPQSLVNRCLRMLNVEAHNLYGPTETGESSAEACSLQERGPDVVPIGDPISNTRYYLLNPAGIPLPHGLEGELYIAGDCLAEGYLRDPEKTGERFLSLPWIPDQRLYRTGDLVAWNAEQALEYHGRNDHQIKIRGFRVELGEIESALARLQGVRMAAARYCAHSPQGPCIVADYTGDAHCPEPRDAVRSLKELLPGYMVPARIFKRERLPLTASGKVDRNALPEPDFTLMAEPEQRPNAAYEQLTPWEQKLAALWGKLLGQNEQTFHRASDFFQSGGHSLLLMQMVIELRKQSGVEVRLPVFLQEPTLGHLAALCGAPESCAERDRSLERARADADTAIQWERTTQPAEETSAILLTGAAGFVGSHILAKLLSGQKRRIIALIRPKNGLDPMATFENALQSRNIQLTAEERKRVNVIPGDLAASGLGISKEDQRTITEHAGHILHCGAMVNHLYGYAQHRPANVLGTLELIRLAVEAGMKRFDFISTTAAQDAVPDAAWSGYVLSKWTGERLCERLRGHGIDSRILRVGYVAGHSRSGLVDYSRNHLSLLIRSCIETGVAPDWDRQLEITPVDLLADEIAHLIANADARCGDWNLSGLPRFSWLELVALLNADGYLVRTISHDQWYRDYLEQAEPDSALYMLKGLYTDQTPQFAPPPENTFLALCPELKQRMRLDLPELFKRYLHYFQSTDFIRDHGE